MKRHLLRAFCASILQLGLLTAAYGSLIDRGNGLIYDDVLNITWLSDVTAGAGSAFDDNVTGAGAPSGTATDGYMQWGSASAWSASLSYGGYSDWRLPNIDINTDTVIALCQTSTELDCRDNELGYMFYYNLGGTFGSAVVDSGHANLALFTNLALPGFPVSEDLMWFSNPELASGLDSHYCFNLDKGEVPGIGCGDGATLGAWAVRDGDVSVVPVPATVWLFGSGLIGLIGMARRKKA